MTHPANGLCPFAPARRAMLRQLLAGMCALTGLSVHADELPWAVDLQREIATAAARAQPLVLLVTLDGCAYCDRVRRLYLQPLHALGHVPVVQIDMRSRTSLRDPTGRTAHGEDLVRQWKVTVAPTVLFLGPGGVELAPRLIGYPEDFYAGYLNDALATARKKLARPKG